MHNYLHERTKPSSTRRPRLGDPHDPRRRRGFRIRDHQQGRLDRATAGGRQIPRRTRIHLRRRGASVGALCRLWHERRHRGRRRPLLAPRGHLKAGPSPALDAYEAERQPITEQVSHFAMNHAPWRWRSSAAPCRRRSRTNARGRRGPREARPAAYDFNVQQYCCGRAELRLLLRPSPIIAYDGETPPPYSMAVSPLDRARLSHAHIRLRDGPRSTMPWAPNTRFFAATRRSRSNPSCGPPDLGAYPSSFSISRRTTRRRSTGKRSSCLARTSTSPGERRHYRRSRQARNE